MQIVIIQEEFSQKKLFYTIKKATNGVIVT